jgi:phenylacetate-CoA ligase
MPLIRYAMGDLAVAGSHPCDCGSAFPVIDRVEGRRDEVLTTPEGRLIGRLDPVFKAIHSVFESQIVQDRLDHVRVDVVARDGFSAAEERRLITGLQQRLGPSMRIDVVRVQRIPRTRSGKLCSVVNRVHNKPAHGTDDER